MRILLPLILAAFTLVFCRNNDSPQNQKTQNQITYDTIKINIKGYLKQTVKFNSRYYCFFDEDKPYGSDGLTFYVISKDGKTQNKVFVPDDMQHLYSDLHIRNDSILSKDYYDHRTYYFDLIKSEWKEVKKVDDRVFEDNNYYATFLDFGEFGGTLWFKNKQTGIEYEMASGPPIINKLNGKYYVSTAKKVIEIENPAMLNRAAQDSTYEIIKNKKWSMGSRSMKGAKVIFIDSVYSNFRDYKFYIASSYVINNELKFVIVDSNSVYTAEIKNGKAFKQDSIFNNSTVSNWHNSYRQNLNQNSIQLLQFSSSESKTFGFIEIGSKNIKVHYIKNLDTAPIIGRKKAESTFINRLDFLIEKIGDLTLNQVDSLELLLRAFDATPRHKMSMSKDYYPNKEDYIIESPRVYKTIEDSTLTLLTNYWYTKPDKSVKVFTCEWEPTFENAYNIYTKFDAPELKDSYQNRFNNIYSHLIKKFGNPVKPRKNDNGQYFSWKIRNNLNIVLYYANADRYKNIDLKMYKD
jgi:hypothetical protein